MLEQDDPEAHTLVENAAPTQAPHEEEVLVYNEPSWLARAFKCLKEFFSRGVPQSRRRDD